MKCGPSFKKFVGFKAYGTTRKILLKPGEWVANGITSWQSVSSVVSGSHIRIFHTYAYYPPSTIPFRCIPNVINVSGYNKLTFVMKSASIYNGAYVYISDKTSDYTNISQHLLTAGTHGLETIVFDLTGRSEILLGVRLASANGVDCWVDIESVTLS